MAISSLPMKAAKTPSPAAYPSVAFTAESPLTLMPTMPTPRPFRRQSPIRLSMPVTFSMPVAGSTHSEALRLVKDPMKSAGRLSSPVRRNPRLLQTT